MTFPTAYFPSISYLKELCVHQSIQIETHEHWIKQSIRNRCEILTANGIQRLTVPILHEGNKQSIESVKIVYSDAWTLKHWQAIKTAYGKAPYFEAYHFEIEGLIKEMHQHLIDKNNAILWFFIDAWDLPIKYESTDHFVEYKANDFRIQNWLTREEMPFYQQVFGFEKVFTPNLSILDLLFCEGPLGRNFILN